MIKINLKPTSTCVSLDNLASNYSILTKDKITSKSSALLEVFKIACGSPPAGLSNIDGQKLTKIVSLFTSKKIKYIKGSLIQTVQKQNFINLHASAFNPAILTPPIIIEIGEMLSFLSNQSKVFRGFNLEDLVAGKPRSIESISKALNIEFSDSLQITTVKNILLYIFDYTTIHTDKKIRKLLSDNLNVNVCPYCNRNYISYIEYDESKIIGATMDHFLAKSLHPFLGVSFYNLIPSCYVCNSNLKGKHETTLEKHLNPYLDGFDNAAKFSLVPTASGYSTKLVLDYKSDKSERILPTAKNKRTKKRNIDGNINMFRLNEIYELGHFEDVEHIIEKCDQLQTYYANNTGQLLGGHSNFAEFYTFHFNNILKEKDHNKKPLSKMTMDLVTERLPWLII